MRADKFFAEKFGSRTKAAEAIDRGLILVNGKQIRPKDNVENTDEIKIDIPDEYYVSNGGYKLSKAIRELKFNCTGLVCADIGASTGGFTDCLIQNGAKKVYAIDVGESLLHPTLAQNKKIVSLENINARYLTKDIFSDEIDCVTTDVSFISLKHIFPVIKNILKENGIAFVLIKPQFECEKQHISKNGIVHLSAHHKIIEKILKFAQDIGFSFVELVVAPVRKKKNIEYILCMKNGTNGDKTIDDLLIQNDSFIKLYKEV